MLFFPVLLQFHKVLLLNSPPGNPRLPRLPRSVLPPIFQLPQWRYRLAFGRHVSVQAARSVVSILILDPSSSQTQPAPPTRTRIVFFARNGLGFDPCPHSGRVSAQPCGYLKVLECQSALVPFGQICFLGVSLSFPCEPHGLPVVHRRPPYRASPDAGKLALEPAKPERLKPIAQLAPRCQQKETWGIIGLYYK